MAQQEKNICFSKWSELLMILNRAGSERRIVSAKWHKMRGPRYLIYIKISKLTVKRWGPEVREGNAA